MSPPHKDNVIITDETLEELKELLEPIHRKIEMADYISAVENVVRIKNKLSGKER